MLPFYITFIFVKIYKSRKILKEKGVILLYVELDPSFLRNNLASEKSCFRKILVCVHKKFNKIPNSFTIKRNSSRMARMSMRNIEYLENLYKFWAYSSSIVLKKSGRCFEKICPDPKASPFVV